MCPRVLTSTPFFIVGLACAVALPAHAQIAAKSPFMPPQASATTGPTAGAPLEYRGYLETSDGTLFRIYDPAKKSSVWVKVNERNPDFGVTAKRHRHVVLNVGKSVVGELGSQRHAELRRSGVVTAPWRLRDGEIVVWAGEDGRIRLRRRGVPAP